MGNKISRRRADVDERYTQPQGLQEHKEGDYRRLRRLILNGQLAPCFPGAEENALDLDECPICFLFYPSLNRSRCCSKPICTECYLQIKSSGFGRSTHCPFCKTSSFMVEYRGAKTLEEKSFEQAEEQKVIEAKIRIRQEELRGEEEKVPRLGEDTQAEELDVLSAREQGLHLFNGPTPDIRHLQICQPEDPFEHETNQMSAHREYVQTSFCSSDRYDDLDMEDIMYMEAIWLSIQDQGQAHEDFAVAQQIPTSNASSEAELRSMAGGRRLVAGGLAEAIAALAERESSTVENRTGSEAVIRNHTDMTSLRYRDPDTRPIAVGKQVATLEKGLSGEWKCPKQLNGWIDASQGSEGRDIYDWVSSQSSEAAAVGTSFSFNIPSASDLASESPDLDPTQSSHNLGEACLSSTSASVMPETFEEQIMLAMALSLAESQAQARR